MFQLCPSYPASVVVPVKISDDTLKASAQFRQSGRFPVLSYYHKRNGVRIEVYNVLDDMLLVTCMCQITNTLIGCNSKLRQN